MKVIISARDGHKEVTLSRRLAIREKCLDCSGWVPKDVRTCKIPDCPLRPFRSGQGKQDPTERQRAIRAMCMWCTLDQPKEIRLCPATDCPLYAYRLGRIDRSVEIKPSAKNGQIAA